MSSPSYAQNKKHIYKYRQTHYEQYRKNQNKHQANHYRWKQIQKIFLLILLN